MKAKQVLHALVNPIRWEMMILLSKNGKMNPQAFEGIFGKQQSEISHHLGILKRADLVQYEKDGKYRWYSINVEKIEKVSNALRNFFGTLAKA